METSPFLGEIRNAICGREVQWNNLPGVRSEKYTKQKRIYQIQQFEHFISSPVPREPTNNGLKRWTGLDCYQLHYYNRVGQSQLLSTRIPLSTPLIDLQAIIHLTWRGGLQTAKVRVYWQSACCDIGHRTADTFAEAWPGWKVGGGGRGSVEEWGCSSRVYA